MEIDRSSWHRSDLFNFPPPFMRSSLVFHHKKKSLFLLGGINPKNHKDNAIWKAKDKEWTPSEGSYPFQNQTFNAAYDEERELVVVFGMEINDDERRGETWSFDGEQWLLLKPKNSPIARFSAGMTYDSVRKQIVLFGGQLPDGRFPIPGNDTWIWDGDNWKQHHSDDVPSRRMGARMVFDTARQVIILFGGVNGGGYLSDTWVWNGDEWKIINTTLQPPARAYHGMAFDSDKQKVVLYGGFNLEGAMNDTWIWNGENWSQLQPNNNPPIATGYDTHLVYNPDQKSIMLYSVVQEVTDGLVQADSEVWNLTY